MATTNLGRVSIVPKGTWNASTTYKKLDLVAFEGSSYIALQNNLNKPVSNTTYWQKIAQKGDQGIQGIQGIQGETGNGIASIEITNTSGAVKTYTITYTNGNTTTFQVTDGEVTNEVLAEELEAYALIDGYYEEMTVGAAENLTGKGTGVPAIFTRRTAGGTADIADGVVTIKSIKGNTLLWNQVYRYRYAMPNLSGFEGWASNAVINTTNKTIAVTNTRESYASMGVSYIFNENEMITNHKYYLATTLSEYSVTDEHTPNIKVVITKGWYPITSFVNNVIDTDAVQNKKYSTIFTLPDTSDLVDEPFRATTYVGYPGTTGYRVLAGDSFTLKNVMFIDLTKMFGAGNEPITPEEFETLFPLNYYDIDNGSFINFTGESLKTIGFNQWDEEWERGTYSSETGEKSSYAGAIRSVNHIPVLPNTDYNITKPNGKYTRIFYYDINKNFISAPDVIWTNQPTTVFTTPANAYYMNFFVYYPDGNYQNDICINLSWSGYRNGEYEEYWERTRALPISTYFPNGMHSTRAYYDELQNNKIIKRTAQKIVDGNIEWDHFSAMDNDETYFFEAQIATNPTSDSIPRYNTNENTLLTTFGRVYNTWNNTSNVEGVCHHIDTRLQLRILKSRLTAGTSAALKAYLTEHPFYITYVLNEEVVTSLETPLNLNYIVSDFGTEEILPENTSVPTTSPINADIVYGMNAADTLRRLPENYISKDSMQAFLSVLNNVTSGTWSMTYNSGTNKYTFNYVANPEEQQGGE